MDIPSFLTALLASSAATAVVGWLLAPRSNGKTLSDRIAASKALAVGLPDESHHELMTAIRVDTLRLASLSVVRWKTSTTTYVIYIMLTLAVIVVGWVVLANKSISTLATSYKKALVDYGSLSTWLIVAATASMLILMFIGLRYAGRSLLNAAREAWVQERLQSERASDPTTATDSLEAAVPAAPSSTVPSASAVANTQLVVSPAEPTQPASPDQTIENPALKQKGLAKMGLKIDKTLFAPHGDDLFPRYQVSEAPATADRIVEKLPEGVERG